MSQIFRLLRPLRRRRGMTLMEVMIVLAIIIMLMGVLTFGLRRMWESSQRDAAEIAAHKVDQEVVLFKARYRKLPEDLDEVYRGEDPPTDPWGNPFQLRKDGERAWRILSYGPDGREGGTGRDEDIEVRGG